MIRRVMMRLTWIVVIALVTACVGKKAPPRPPRDAAERVGAPPGSAPAGDEASRDLTFKNGDVTIAGTYWPPTGNTGACVLFVHQLGSTRAEWQPIIDRLRGRAHLFAIDMRGHGASTGGPNGFAAFTDADWKHVQDDVGLALGEFVRAGGGPRCVLVGASIGSSAVLRYAGSHPGEARALVLLSPGLDYHGLAVAAVARHVTVPVLIVHSQEPGAADAAAQLAAIWRATPTGAVDIIADPGTAHGMKIVNGDPKILDQVVAFLERQLGA
jgi:pimeloyl-ACP methyl ester carboxylesterase